MIPALLILAAAIAGIAALVVRALRERAAR